ncbi:restriction endonuclease subunit S [Escherichia coli]|uniref:restriction endonuclease subunit S n=2 Tax=Escherichia coli TaxID=562 RepID=UPI0004D3FBE3|nr:restriction endonuclease subunit S [Escherichia coli]HED1548841.1 restriction endonuclease subunit S [Citrobacter freundii]EFB2484884.1 restriction endonuclease subunit S [Escherichia coli]EFM2062632.1 restriction endonuclease subunit S [Escherichia coli]EGP5908847.1 restriction endonuclease subunit S [Escherichia coli]KDT81553.1 type I restriction modification DNA specificity domain protein [Escherichia coli 3-373-03_S1_C2]
MVPKGWEKNSLDSLFEFKNGLNTEKEQYGNGYKFVNVMDVFRNDILTESKIIGRVQVTDKQLEGYQLKYGDVLFNRTSETFDEIAIAAIYLDNAIATFGGFVIRARPKGNQIDPAYSVFLFQSKSYRSQVVKLGQGAIRANIGQKDLARVCILVPPLAEQKKIAQILSTWDKAISVTEKLLTNSQQQKKALMQQLLTGKKRLLDENGVRFSGEWKRVKLGAIADMNSGGTPKSTVEEYYGGNIPWVSISDMTSNGKWIATTEKYLTELGLNSSSARIYPKNSVLYAMYASIGECSIAAVNLTSSQAILGIRPKDCLNYEFLYFYLTSLKEKIKLQGQQGTQSNLNAGMVKEFELDLPSIREQQKIAAVLSAADAEISTLEKKLACLRDEKKALMQQLLTGKRRVKVDEAVAE